MTADAIFSSGMVAGALVVAMAQCSYRPLKRIVRRLRAQPRMGSEALS